MKIISLTRIFLKDIIRQKTIIFSSFILPIVIIWSTWWVTADVQMLFSLDTGRRIITNMIDVHVVTGGLTAMAITAGLFGFIITSSYQNIAIRLKQVGFTSVKINLAILLTLFILLILTSLVAISLSLSLARAESVLGLIVSIFLVTLIYVGLGNAIGTIFPDITAGSLIILIFSFMDLMLFSNPMGEGLYLMEWTHYTPGFWPVQIALESGFAGYPENINIMVFNSLLYFVILTGSSLILKKIGLTMEDRQ